MGCTAVQLKRSTLGQFRTVTDLYEQQVLDNLAMFVHDPYSLPFFNLPQTGTSEVKDTGKGVTGAGFGRTGNLFWLSSQSFGFDASRDQRLGWTTAPVRDPKRLELMRCAYQKAVASVVLAYAADLPTSNCPDCVKRWKSFYGDGDNGRVNALECLGVNGCWFSWGRKEDVPKSCPCSKVGSYCGTYVWINECGTNEFSKLVLMVLDFAGNDPASKPTKPTKTVTLFLDADGKQVSKEAASRIIERTVDADESIQGLIEKERIADKNIRKVENLEERVESIKESLEILARDEDRMTASESWGSDPPRNQLLKDLKAEQAELEKLRSNKREVFEEHFQPPFYGSGSANEAQRLLQVLPSRQ